MQEAIKLPPINQACFSKSEIEMYNEQLSRQHGAKAKAIMLSGLTKQTWTRAMSGKGVMAENLKKISKANMKVIAHILKAEAV